MHTAGTNRLWVFDGKSWKLEFMCGDEYLPMLATVAQEFGCLIVRSGAHECDVQDGPKKCHQCDELSEDFDRAENVMGRPSFQRLVMLALLNGNEDDAPPPEEPWWERNAA